MKPLGEAFSVQFSPDSSLLAVLRSAEVAIYTGPEWNLAATIPARDAASIRFSPNSQLLSIKTIGGSLLVSRIHRPNTPTDELVPGLGEGPAAEFHPNGEYLLDGSWSGLIRRVGSGGQSAEDLESHPKEMVSRLHWDPRQSQWLVHWTPKALTNDQPPRSDYFSYLGSGCTAIPPDALGEVAFTRDSLVSACGRYLACISGAPPNRLTLLDRQDGVTRSAEVSITGAGGRLHWSRHFGLLLATGDRVLCFSSALEAAERRALPYACEVAVSGNGLFVAIGSWENGVVLGAELLGERLSPESPC